MIYSIFLKNLSQQKTWWDVDIWDTVPPEIDPWCNDCGMEDPCTGWTMTPSGCAAAAPGSRIVGTATILTWKLRYSLASTTASPPVACPVMVEAAEAVGAHGQPSAVGFKSFASVAKMQICANP